MFLEFSFFFYILYFLLGFSIIFVFLLFSIILLKHHDQDNLYKEGFILGLRFQTNSVLYHWGWKSMAAQMLSAHILHSKQEAERSSLQMVHGL